MRIIDTHTHAFPDFLAGRAMEQLMHTPNLEYRAYHRGKVSDLLSLMDKAGIEKSVIQSIATRPEQAEKILQWSVQIKSGRIEPFISLHPENRERDDILKEARANGIRGVKIHPHYQGVNADDEIMFPLYESIAKHGFILFFHSGQDLAFPGCDNASVPRMRRVLERIPEMKCILAHFGAYREWDMVLETLAGRNIYFETSFILEEAGEEMFLKILAKHPADRILFGTDSPWTDPVNAVKLMKKCRIPDETREKIFHKNFEALMAS